MGRRTRRSLLCAGCLACSVGLAGCLGLSDDEPTGTADPGAPADSPDDASSPADEPRDLGEDAVVWQSEDARLPTLRDGTLYGLGTDDSGAPCVRSLDASSGEQRWCATVGDGHTVPTEPVVADGVYVGFTADAGGGVQAFDRDGSDRWLESTAAAASRPHVHDGTVVAGFDDGTVRAVDGESGSIAWTRELDAGSTQARVVGAADGTVVATLEHGTAFGLDASDGTTRFETDAGSGFEDALLDDGLSYSTPASTGQLSQGSIAWAVDTDGPERLHGRIDDVLVVGDGDAVVARDADAGESLWRVPAAEESPVLVGDDRIHVGTTDLRTVAADGETVRSVALDGTAIGALASDGEAVYAATADAVFRVGEDGGIRSTSAVEGARRVVLGERAYVSDGAQTYALDL